MNPDEDEVYCRYCTSFSTSDPKKLLNHMLVSHNFAPEVQGLKAADNSNACIICASNSNSKMFSSYNALESHMDRVHHGWESAYPNCQKKNCKRVFLNKEEYESHKPTCGKK